MTGELLDVSQTPADLADFSGGSGDKSSATAELTDDRVGPGRARS
jgi:hypothetical protein